MRWLLDSNIIIDALAGLPEGLRVFSEARSQNIHWLGYSSITRIEVLGFPKMTEAQEAAAQEFLRSWREVPVSAAIIQETIRIRKAVRVKIPDAIIAATAKLSRATVITRDTADFERISGIEAVDPAKL